MNFLLPVSQGILTEVSNLDRFQGQWSAQQLIAADRLERIREAATVRSTGASCRLAGIHVRDAEVAALLRGDTPELDDVVEVAGYARAVGGGAPGSDELLSGDWLRRLHAQIMRNDPNAPPSPWRENLLHREAFDANGQATGQVFPTLPPRFVARKTEELITWLELELRTRQQHPILVVGAFVLCLLSISPFERANGRMARLLGGLMLRRAGYDVIPFASIEAQMEELRDQYYEAISRSQTRLWTDEANLEPWLDFFLEVLRRHQQQVEAKLALERDDRDYPPLQRAILEAVREHGSVDAALLLKATGANRNTLKDNLRRLVQRGVLEKTGQRRGTRYRLSTGESVPVASTVDS